MNKYIFLLAVFCSALFTSCGSDEPDAPIENIFEDSYTYAKRTFANRYSLPQDKILDLEGFQGIGSGSTGVYAGTNNNNIAIFVCDILSNKLLYNNFNALHYVDAEEFVLPYGNTKQFEFTQFGLSSIAHNSSITAFSGFSVFGEFGTQNSAFKHYQFLFTNGELLINERPYNVKTLYDRDRVINWFNNSVIFYVDRNTESSIKDVVCYDNKGQHLFDTTYPYFFVDSQIFDLFESNLVQPVSEYCGMGVKLYGGVISVFVTDIYNHTILWHKDSSIDDYKTNDRIEFVSNTFNGNVLEFDIKITSYIGDQRTIHYKVSTEGDIMVS